MTSVKIVCACQQLVDVVDKKIVEHQKKGAGLRCPASGLRYVPSRGGRSFSPDIPQVSVVAEGPITCPSCGKDGHAYGVLLSSSVDYGETVN